MRKMGKGMDLGKKDILKRGGPDIVLRDGIERDESEMGQRDTKIGH